MARIAKDCNLTIARLAGDSTALDEAAARVIAHAQNTARAHLKTGAYAASLRVSKDRSETGKGVTDRVVYSTDPAALPIEMGFKDKQGTHHGGIYALIGAINQ